MELETSLTRRFREDSLSDLVIAAFLQLAHADVAVLTPNETRTGSDFDLELIDATAGETIRYRIQAKRLSRPTVDPAKRSYAHLAYPGDTGAQAATLCDPANLAGPIPTIPLYAFFNPESACHACSTPGIALADAFDVESHVRTVLLSRPRPLFKRISALAHLFFELDDILCPGTQAAGTGVASPRLSRDRFERVSRDLRRRPADAPGRPVPQPGSVQPELIAALRLGSDRRVRAARTPRPRVIIAGGDVNALIRRGR